MPTCGMTRPSAAAADPEPHVRARRPAATRRAKRTRVSRGVGGQWSERTEACAAKHVAQAVRRSRSDRGSEPPRAAAAAARAAAPDRAPRDAPTAPRAHRVDCWRRWPSARTPGERAQSPAAAERHLLSDPPPDKWRQLDDRSRRRVAQVGTLRIRGIADHAQWRHAGIDAEAMRREHVEGRGDRSLIDHSGARNSSIRTTPASTSARRQRTSSSANSSSVELVDAAMRVAVRSDVVPARDNVAHERRVPFGYPSEHEEGRPSVVVREQIQKATRGVDDSAGQRWPPFERERTTHTADVEPLLDVDAESVHHAARLVVIRSGRGGTAGLFDIAGNRSSPIVRRRRRSVRRRW